ncbi:hypothetical protein ANN_19997 [Periplaneta americana]|uniref:Uncharacterized protein n=1 Tax=Periplaneta americana TaxID=6978 RepID=A0ABQ8SCG4_PERAM|nr:hypothetical protein ANN_19997 [Periplaneta americana]
MPKWLQLKMGQTLPSIRRAAEKVRITSNTSYTAVDQREEDLNCQLMECDYRNKYKNRLLESTYKLLLTQRLECVARGNACCSQEEAKFPVLLASELNVDVSAVKNLNVRIYKTVILPVVLYGYETWTLTLREEQRLRVFENKVLRKIFGVKRDEVTGEWRKLHNAELHGLYSSPDIIRNIKSRRLRWSGHVACMGESRNAYRVIAGKLEEKRPLGRSRLRWEDNVKMDLREVGYDDRDWINLARIGTDAGLI